MQQPFLGSCALHAHALNESLWVRVQSAARRSAAVYGTAVPSSLAIAAALASGQLSFPARCAFPLPGFVVS